MSTFYQAAPLMPNAGNDYTSAEIRAGLNSRTASSNLIDEVSPGQAASSVEVQPVNSLEVVIQDMTLSSDEAKPHGVPSSYSWYNPVRYQRWDVPTTRYPDESSSPHIWNSYTGWGQLYEAADQAGNNLNRATNTRVQLEGMKTFYLSRSDEKWHLLQSSQDVEGAAYREDFLGDVSIVPNVRKEADDSVSVVPGGGYNYHFWASNGRETFANPLDIAGIFVTVKARLITNDLTQVDDRNQAKYVMNVGGDIWYNENVGWDNMKTNRDTGMGRFKLVTPEWQSFNMYSLEASNYLDASALIKNNPPPINLP